MTIFSKQLKLMDILKGCLSAILISIRIYTDLNVNMAIKINYYITITHSNSPIQKSVQPFPQSNRPDIYQAAIHWIQCKWSVSKSDDSVNSLDGFADIDIGTLTVNRWIYEWMKINVFLPRNGRKPIMYFVNHWKGDRQPGTQTFCIISRRLISSLYRGNQY